MADTPLVLHGPALSDPAVVGHKFARQTVLRDNGFPVPAFFCVPATAFDGAVAGAVATAADPDRATTGTEDDTVLAALTARRIAILANGVPTALASAIEDAVEALVGAGGLVAVRACVVTGADSGVGVPDVAEDGADDPFAGLSDSFLYVGRVDVVRRVAECWASAYHPHAVAYRLRRGVDPASVRVAVGVQRMIDGRRSFVAFTRDPRDGADRRVVAAAHGIGEGVVQERADIDHFFLDPVTSTIERALVTKSTMVGLDPAEPAAGPRELPVPQALRTDPVLSDEEIRAICALAEDAERHFGAPQDIEGTLTADGETHLVQSRPMVLPSTKPGPPAATTTTIWTNHNITESFPGVTCALTFSQAVEFYRLGFGDFYRRMGVPASTLRRAQADLRGMIGLLDGRAYYQLDVWYRLHGNLPLFGLLRPAWQRVIGLSGTELTDAPPARTTSGQLVRGVARMAVVLAAFPTTVRRFLRWWDDYVDAHGDLDGRTAEELLTRHRDLWSRFAKRWAVTLVNSYFLMAALVGAEKLLARWVPEGGDGLLPALLAGGRENRSLAALRSALALAELLRGNASAVVALHSDSAEHVHARLVAGEFGTELAGALREHLHRYGDRTLHDLKLEIRTPRQEPWTLLGLLRPLVDQQLTVADSRADEQRSRREGIRRLREACPNRPRRLALRTVVAGLRWFIRVREDTRFCRSQLYGLTRDIMWRLGRCLVEAGQLDSAEEVFHLTVEEVIAAASSAGPVDDLRARVESRRTALAESAARQQPPAYLKLSAADAASFRAAAPLHPLSSVDSDGARGEQTLHGLASASGLVRAPARVVLSPAADAEDIRDRILVARETDPGWLYLMLVAKGIVVERGSLLSHTAITGRLLGIPTVVAVPGATTAIADGRLIELDGAAGTVRLLAGEEMAA